MGQYDPRRRSPHHRSAKNLTPLRAITQGNGSCQRIPCPILLAGLRRMEKEFNFYGIVGELNVAGLGAVE